MKKMIAVLLALTLLCGCTPQTQTEASAAATLEPATEAIQETVIPTASEGEEELRGFTMPYISEEGLNPYECQAMVNRGMMSLLYEPLFTVNSRFQAQPLLCDSFSVSSDGMTYTFKLLPDVKFSDGSAMTATDVVASVQAARWSKLYRMRLQNMLSCYALDDQTVQVQLTTAYENFTLMMDIPIVKQDSIERSVPIGSGPYAFANDKLTRNSNWWSAEPPVIDLPEISLYLCKDYFEIRDAFQFGSVDFVYCDPNSAAAGGYRCDFEVWEVPSTVMGYIGFNYASGYFAKETLRKAVTYGVDRNRIVSECCKGFATPSVLPCSPKSDLYDVNLAKQYELNVSLLAKAVNDSGVKTDPEYQNHVGYLLVCNDDPGREEAANIIAKTLNDAGLNIQVIACNFDSFNLRLGSGDYDFYIAETRMTADFDLSQFFLDYGSVEIGSMVNERLAGMCGAAYANSGNYLELCKQMMACGGLCPIYFKSYGAYVTRGKLLSPDPAVDFVFRSASFGRTLSDADKTYEERESENNDADGG